jgi:hypothetical protein
MSLPPPTAHCLYLAFVHLLRDLDARDPESGVQCMRVIGEWPASYVVFPAEDTREPLADVLATLLDRPFPTVLPRWRMSAKEARDLVELCAGEEEHPAAMLTERS